MAAPLPRRAQWRRRGRRVNRSRQRPPLISYSALRSSSSGISKHSLRGMEHLSIERLRSPRSPRSFFYPESENNSGSSTPFVSAPCSPHYYYYSTPPSPPRSRSRAAAEEEEDKEAAVPFSWEEKPGTPKRNATAANSSGFSFLRTDDSTQVGADAPIKTSVEHLSAIGFHFSAPVSPKRGSPRGGELRNSGHLLDEFEFSSARMSDADSFTSASMSHADELFFQGQLLPLKLPPRLQQQPHAAPPSLHLEASLFYSPRAAAFAHQFSPRSPKSPKRKEPARPAAATAEWHQHRRARSLSPLKFFNDDGKNSSSENKQHRPASKASPVRRSLRELFHLNTAQQSTTKRGSNKMPDSRSSSVSSTSSQTFLGSRSSSVSSTNSQSRSNSISSRQVNPVSSPRGEQHFHYSSRAKKVNDDQLRRRTFLPYKPGLLGCLSCITIAGVRGIRE